MSSIDIKEIIIVHSRYGPSSIFLIADTEAPYYPYEQETTMKINAAPYFAEDWVKKRFPTIPCRVVGP